MASVSFDFQSIKDRLIKRLQAKSEWASFLRYGVIDNLLDPICQELAYCMQYQEYLTYENWWSKARNKSSLLVQSSVHGYNVPRKQGSRGTLRISTSEQFATPYKNLENILIPKFFQFSGNGIYVVADNDYILNSSVPYIDIQGIQGEFKEISFSAEGNTYEEKMIIDANIENSFYDLYVNGNLWKEVDTLFEANENDQVYEIETKPDLSGIILKFGNNIFGKKLNLNDKVVFKYIATNGLDGNIFASNIITRVESQAFDSKGKPVKLFVNNISSFIGGKDYPTIEEIRTLSPKVYQTGDRASSTIDYKTIIDQFTYISKSNIWGAYETLKDEGRDTWEFIPSEENVVHVALLDMAYNNLTDVEKNQVIDDLHIKNDPTDLIRFETVAKIPLIFNVDGVLKNSSYTILKVKGNIEEALKKAYGIENIQFNTNIYNSDFTRLVDEVDGIRNHNSFIQIKKDKIKFNEAYVCDFVLPVYPIDYESLVFYIKDNSQEEPKFIPFAYSDFNGSIIGYEGFNTNGSNINLTTGVGAITINSGIEGDYTTFEIKIIYQGANQDLLLKQRYDIFYYDESNITLQYPTM